MQILKADLERDLIADDVADAVLAAENEDFPDYAPTNDAVVTTFEPDSDSIDLLELLASVSREIDNHEFDLADEAEEDELYGADMTDADSDCVPSCKPMCFTDAADTQEHIGNDMAAETEPEEEIRNPICTAGSCKRWSDMRKAGRPFESTVKMCVRCGFENSENAMRKSLPLIKNGQVFQKIIPSRPHATHVA